MGELIVTLMLLIFIVGIAIVIKDVLGHAKK